MHTRLAVFAASSFLIAGSAQAVVLYDGSLGTTPAAQGLGFVGVPSGNYLTTAGGITTVDTTASDSIYGGFVTAPVVLDRAVGFSVRIDIKVDVSNYTSAARSGFDVIALGSDTKGIEIGFHDNEIFSLDASFNRKEVAPFDTASLHSYSLNISNDQYALVVNGSTVLTGGLYLYPATAPINPYQTPNFLFFGDDTTSASGKTEVSYLSVTVPEPGMMGAVIALGTLGRNRRRVLAQN